MATIIYMFRSDNEYLCQTESNEYHFLPLTSNYNSCKKIIWSPDYGMAMRWLDWAKFEAVFSNPKEFVYRTFEKSIKIVEVILP